MPLLPDLRHASRVLARSPLFTLTAALSLAIGIAANAAIFSLADAVLLRDRPGIAAPGRLVDVGRRQRGQVAPFDNFSYADYRDYRERNRTLEDLAAYRFEAMPVGLGSRDAAERIYGTLVTANYFAVLGTTPAAGRLFAPGEDRTIGTAPLVVLSHAFWTRRFGGDPSVVGHELRLNGVPFTVVGVAEAGFAGTNVLAADVFLPLTMNGVLLGDEGRGLFTERRTSWILGIGRLKPGVSVAQARADLDTVAAALEREFPESNRGRGASVGPSARLPGFFRTMVTGFIGLLFALVGVVLLIACTNVAGMQLARAVARSREVAVRLAIGAGRGRIVRQLVTESVLLAALGGLLGVVGAVWMVSLLRAFQPDLPVPLALDLRVDWRVVTFGCALALVSGVLFGLAPAWHAARTDLTGALKGDGGARGPRRLRLRHAFVVGQVAMSVLLLVSAGLFARAVQQAGAIDPGFRAANVDGVSVDLRLARYSEQTGRLFVERVLERLRALPGVTSAATTRMLPLTGGGLGLGRITVEGGERPSDLHPDPYRADWNVVSPGYFETMGTAILQGRDFAASDDAGSAPVAIVNDSFARRAWPGRNPIGQRFLQEEGPPGSPRTRAVEVIGVARNGKYRSIGEDARMFVYVPVAQQYMADLTFVVHRTGGPALADIQAVLHELDPNLPVVAAQPLSAAIEVGLLPQRLAAAIAGAFGLVGLLLAMLGIYGVTAYTVTLRTHEIGVRVAIGAARGDVLRLVLRQALVLTTIGGAVGFAASAGAAHLLGSLLYGIPPTDPITFASVALVLLACATLAAWGPARRAAGLDPTTALKQT